jgi:HEAT repeat protein
MWPEMNTLLSFLFLTLAPLLLLAPAAAARQQDTRFTPVEGASLPTRLEAARGRAAAAGQSRYWTAYSFDVRPGVAVDFEYVSEDGRVTITNSGAVSFDWDGARFNPPVETRDLGVFVLREADGAVSRVEVYNLARRRDYAGHPVFWLGRAPAEESLTFLRGLAEAGQNPDVATGAVRAVALHDDRRVPETLERIARASRDERVRAHAVRSLGLPPVSPQTRDFLTTLARDTRESIEVRRAAVSAVGRARDPQALALLTSLYDAAPERELRRTVMAWVGRNENRSAAVNFLVRVAGSDADTDLRRHALAQLGEIAGERALGALSAAAERRDADTELQRQAVAAIGRRPAAESVPLLIKYAQTHSKPEIRKLAVVLLGRSGDPAALEFLRNFLTR